MDAKVIKFPTDSFTTEEAIEEASKMKFSEVMIVGFDENEDFFVITSRMTKRDVLWLNKLVELELFLT
jgi:hypothetical protein